MRIPDYPRATSVSQNNVFLMDGPDGTKSVLASDMGFIYSVPFQIITTDWQPSTTYPGYNFQATLLIDGVTLNDDVFAGFDLGSLIANFHAHVAPAGDSISGGVIFYAQEIPETNMAGTYTIVKGVVI